MPSNYKAKKAYRAPGSLTAEKRLKFLEHLTAGISLAGAARAVGVSHSTVYELRGRDQEFAAAIDSAREAGSDRMEDALLGMGIKDKQYTPLIFLLKGRRPQVYRDNVQVAGVNGGVIQHDHVHRIVYEVVDPSADARVIEHKPD
jgi:hypothetical protein